ncbi:RNA 2'-phosphotransferase [Frigoriglobus tundricola]|uniref:Probable RNA 2'-phosphotransferase n=1 Tax=Frigoriglobus tundricola TaxID=2774151 RepID=A0A6M5Z2E4_9BACT|nr:RNA 2'-phosphotransferase [Frigoriglobus tundricola]QJX00399.1 RNA:NAD 2'-phosphotransferase [Frigoriglobus tundricola]
MDEKRRVRISKFVSLVLRHEPQKAGLTLEPGGWVQIEGLIAGAASAGCHFTRDELKFVVERCEKQRFAIDEIGTHVRANQGHSTEVDLQLEQAEPPAELFHGTAERNLAGVLSDGLLKMARHHVHLSSDPQTAITVGARHGKPVLFGVDAAKMRADGYVFYRSANGVWLVEHVPPQYLRVLERP